FQSVVNGNRLAAGANELIASMQTARMEALRRSRRVVVCTSANANDGADATCANADIDGWITFLDVDQDGDFDKAIDLFPDGTPAIRRNATFSGALEVSGSTTVVYRADGLARESNGQTLLTDGVVRIRIDAAQPRQNVRCIDITAGGVAVRNPNPARDAACS